MKANSTKRKIFDAVDLLTEDTSSQMPVKTMKGGVTMLDIDSIKPFHNHPFHLYEGDRLDDMVESIRDHGILTLSKNGIIANDTVKNVEYRIRQDALNVFDDGVVSGEPVMEAICNKLLEAESGRMPMSDLYKLLKGEPFGLRDGYIPVLIAYALKNYQNVSIYFHGNEHSYSVDELIKALEEPENYTLFICNWNEEETEYIEALEKLFGNYLPGGDDLNRLEELFRAMNSHYASISKSARTTEVYVSDLAKAYRNIMNLSYKDYNKFFFETLPSLNGNLQELVIQLSNIKKELESVSEKQYVRALRVVKQVFDVDENEDLIVALHALKVSHLSGACSGRFLVLPPLTLVALHGEQKYLMRSLPSFIF